MKGLFIVWGREGELSKQYAKALNFQLESIYIKKIGSLTIPTFLRYVVQFFVTIFVLIKNSPKVIAVQNPPVFAVLTVWFYSFLFRRKFLIDSHTAAFLDKKWIFFFPIFKLLARRAILNTCHNYKNLEILKQWGIKNSREVSFAVPLYALDVDSHLENKKIEEVLSNNRKSVMMVNRFAADDDWQLVLKTAQEMQNVNFFITGEVSCKFKEKIAEAPANIIFTDYLKHDDFIKLMRRCDIVLCLTLREDTKLWSIQEALALNKPFIFSDTEVLNYYFKDIGVSTKHNPRSLEESIGHVLLEKENIKEKLKIFTQKNREYFFKNIVEINKILNNK